MYNRIFWHVIILSVLTIGFSSCAKDTEVADPYANWKERNEHFIDSIADVAENSGNEVLARTRTFPLETAFQEDCNC